MTAPGQPCHVCGQPDPAHDWDTHEARQVEYGSGLAGIRAATSMLVRSSSRGGAQVRWLAVHSTEGIMRARDLRDWSSWPGSSHAAADADGVLLTPAEGFVPYHRASWTLRNGNPVSENIELCAWARWTRAEWLARPKLLDACARWLADRCRANGIPPRKLTLPQVRAGWAGIIDHDDYTDATGDGTHWDVGEGFPWSTVLVKVQQLLDPPPPAPIPEPEDPDVAFTDQHAKLLEDLHYGLRRPVVNGSTLSAAVRDIQNRVRDLDAQHAPTPTTAAADPALVAWTPEQLQLLADTLQAELTLEQRQDLAEQLLPEHSRP